MVHSSELYGPDNADDDYAQHGGHSYNPEPVSIRKIHDHDAIDQQIQPSAEVCQKSYFIRLESAIHRMSHHFRWYTTGEVVLSSSIRFTEASSRQHRSLAPYRPLCPDCFPITDRTPGDHQGRYAASGVQRLWCARRPGAGTRHPERSRP